MAGTREKLSSKHNGFLNSERFRKLTEKRQSEVLRRLRIRYAGKPLAIEQIAGYDPRSLWNRLAEANKRAWRQGNEDLAMRLERFFHERYPHWANHMKDVFKDK